MKSFKILVMFISALGLFSSCELDNYEEPDAGLSGRLIDEETNELVQQDIIRGSVVEIIEHGYNPASPQNLIIKNDGTYDNNRLFANKYTVQPKRGNFKPVEAQDIEIKGQTTLDFKVTPYIRIKDLSIVKNGKNVVATFKIQQTNVNKVKKVGLYGHPDPHVGEPMQIARTEQNIEAVTNPNTVYTLSLDTTADPDLIAGKEYFFRVGALTDVGEAKFNYAPAIKIAL
jgi:hypothetical protein